MEKLFNYTPKTLRMWAVLINHDEGYETKIATLLNDLACAMDCGRLFMLNTKPEVETVGTMTAFNVIPYLRGREEHLEALIRTSNRDSFTALRSEARLAEIGNLLMVVDPEWVKMRNL